jgi:hypothetical protein
VLHRPDQPDAAFDLAIVEHDRGGGDLHGGAAGPFVDQQPAPDSPRWSSASSSVTGRLRVRCAMVRSRVSAPCPDAYRSSGGR